MSLEYLHLQIEKDILNSCIDKFISFNTDNNLL